MVNSESTTKESWQMMAYPQSTILVVDDDKEIVQLVKSYLEKEHFQVLTAYDGERALHIARRERPTLIVLDLMLPDRDGWDITRIIRNDETLKQIPIIMLTARIEDADKLIGLELGADDYITKPFNPREVVARVKTVLRRVNYNPKQESTQSNKMLICGSLSLNIDTHTVLKDESDISLTPTEYKILKVLMSNPNMVFTRSDLMEKVFGYVYDSFDRTLDTHIRNLRKKIDAPDQPASYITTVYGVGYRMMELDE